MATARNKLNESYFMASIVISAFLGLVFQSWWVFWIAIIVLIAGSLHSGEIRLNPSPQHRRR